MPELSTLAAVIAREVAPYSDAQASVISRAFTSPPPVNGIGDRYIVGVPGAGAWAGHDHHIAEFTGSAWTFVVPLEGISAWIHDESAELFFNGADWAPNTPDIQRAVNTSANKRMPARTTGADGDRACDIAVAAQPLPGSRIFVYVNGLCIPEIGDGVTTGCACFFSRDGGYTAVPLNQVSMGDVLYWNGSIAGYELDAASDVIEFFYEVA